MSKGVNKVKDSNIREISEEGLLIPVIHCNERGAFLYAGRVGIDKVLVGITHEVTGGLVQNPVRRTGESFTKG